MSNHHNNRVLVREGARELNRQEVERVQGGVGTQTLCTFRGATIADGDPGEC